MTLIDYGATLTSVKLPDHDGNLDEVTLNFDNLSSYMNNEPYLGATVGRVANRVSQACYQHNGQTVQLSKNFASLAIFLDNSIT